MAIQPFSAFGLANTSLFLVVLYFAYNVVYNLYFHPLRHFPGPFLHRATRATYIYRTMCGKMPFDVLPMHDRYGPVVRIAPDQLSFLDVAAWKDIYGRRNDLLKGGKATKGDLGDDEDIARMQKQQQQQQQQHCGVDELSKDPRMYSNANVQKNIMSESRANHARLRRQLLPGFSERAMRDQAPMIQKYVTLLVQRLRDIANHPSGKSADMLCWYSWTAFDIIGDLAFGEPFGYLASGDNDGRQPWIDAMTAVYTGRAVLFCKLTSITGYVFPLLARLFPKAMKAHSQGGIDKIRRRMALVDRRPDLIQGLVEKNEQDWHSHLTIQQIAGTAGILVIAGSETTTKLLTATTYLLLKNPEAMARATAEVRGAFASAQEITLVTATSATIPYVLACINETLRRYPPSATGMPRVTPPGGAMIAGVFVPENTTVACWQMAMNYADGYWEAPNEFRPERFLGENKAKYAKDRQEALQPFSVGPRNCIGRNMAYAEARLVLAQVLYNFDLTLAEPETPDSLDWLDQKAYVLWDTPPMRVVLKEAAVPAAATVK
ncbi:uncharacterized protein SPSK_08965 [Sporothrix schenckii 1099-18]|uniref:Isotrichodermin C-15 hydroxylase n=2 Tax=Sporothrix schenckii TaxID=29908 RepID=U7Q515_SPOS1|nr:uncharacterized protein SPSK_08965 [Sporothrix schenckii 1099-18]ERT02964.1 hypothetical protein HMPREF1624_01268 [Sporothrix schenckii ATCC 58251]KJR84668.1 hypothetical protein SPSK_08965 [Sporothrix schenckii 1099-18]